MSKKSSCSSRGRRNARHEVQVDIQIEQAVSPRKSVMYGCLDTLSRKKGHAANMGTRCMCVTSIRHGEFESEIESGSARLYSIDVCVCVCVWVWVWVGGWVDAHVL